MSGMPSLKLSERAVDFINEDFINGLLAGKRPDTSRVREIIAKSLAKEALSVEETAVLLRADTPELNEEIFDTARQLKKNVYGNRIVLFAPL
jgi:2-iminoacetate synthase